MKNRFYILFVAALFIQISLNAQAEKGKAKAQPMKESPATSATEESEAKPTKKEARKSLHDQYTGQGYGLAGCGLGSVVFGPKPGMIQVAAATTNNYLFPQTFAISSGTSNCDIPEMGMQAASFIENNKEVLKKETARGEGENLNNLAHIYGCKNLDSFSDQLKSNYQVIFNDSNNSYDSSREILKIIKENKELSCSTT